MNYRNSMRRVGVWGVPLGLSFALVTCSHVSRGELDTETLQLRTEMEEGDAALGVRVAGLESRVGAVEARMAQLDAELARLEEQFDAKIERLELAIRFNVPVHFGYNSSDVRDQDREILDRFRAVVTEYYPGADVTVEGFTDPSGSAAANLTLGLKRAESVRTYLIGNGMPEVQVRAVSYGEAPDRLLRPKAQGPGEAGLENRRVVLVIDHGGTPPRVVSAGG